MNQIQYRRLGTFPHFLGTLNSVELNSQFLGRVLPMLTFALAFTPSVYITKCTSSSSFSSRARLISRLFVTFQRPGKLDIVYTIYSSTPNSVYCRRRQ